jgi:hypothetical protein
MHRKLDALIRAAQAAHATYTVYGADPAALSGAQKVPLLAYSHERISRIPHTDVFPDAYRMPDTLREFERELDSRLAHLLGGAVDAGNGAVMDGAVEAAVGAAHFDLEIEHSLRENATLLLVMRNRGDGAMATLQLDSVQEGLREARAEYQRCQEAFQRADRRRMDKAQRQAQRRQDAEALAQAGRQAERTQVQAGRKRTQAQAGRKRAQAQAGRKRARKEVGSHA